MLSLLAVVPVLYLLVPANIPDSETHEQAVAIVRRALDATGGEARWRAVRSLELVGNTTFWHIADSEWLDYPLIPDRRTEHAWRNVAGARVFVEAKYAAQFESPEGTAWTVGTMAAGAGSVAIRDGRRLAGGHLIPPDSIAFLLAPERMLLTALGAPDLRAGRDTVLRLVKHHVVVFHSGRTQVRMFFEAETGFPRMIETIRSFPNEVTLNAWGDVTERTRFSLWFRETTGIVYPRQIDVERAGLPFANISYAHIDVNPVIADSMFSLGDMAVRAAAPCGFQCLRADSLPLGIGGAGGVSDADRGMHEIAPGVIQIVGGWNTTLVRQSDGVVVIEAPISAGYSARVIAEAARRFPGMPIKGVITTTDFWWHVGGLREYVARGIPIYVLDHNVRVVRDRAAAPHSMDPDSLARAPRKPVLRIVRERTTIGTGDNRIEVIPFRSEALDRMQMVYMPGRHLVYTAEAIQLYSTGLFFPQTAFEAADVIRREGLTPVTFIGMHVAATPWSRLTGILDSIQTASKHP